MKTWKFTFGRKISLYILLKFFMKPMFSYHRWFRGQALNDRLCTLCFLEVVKDKFRIEFFTSIDIILYNLTCQILVALLFFYLTFLDKLQILIFSKYMQTCNHCTKEAMRKYVILCIFLQTVTYRSNGTEFCINYYCVMYFVIDYKSTTHTTIINHLLKKQREITA